MDIQKKLAQFQEELSQRKHQMDTRIKILQAASPEISNQRIEFLKAAKKELKVIQDLFYDYFYNELTSIPVEKEGPDLPAIISLDQLLDKEEKTEPHPSTKHIKPFEYLESEPGRKVEVNGEQADQANEKKVKPDMSKIIKSISQLKNKHNSD